MAWRSVVISNPARLQLKNRALHIVQNTGSAAVPLEDIAALVIDCPQVLMTSPVLAACANQQIAVIVVDETHTPTGALLPFTPHSRALKVMQAQLDMTIPLKKRLWQGLVQQKILNQAQVLQQHGNSNVSAQLQVIAAQVKSGDSGRGEAYAAQLYFPALFGAGFTRMQAVFINSALNYGYSIVRAAMARSLVAYGFLPAFGLHHHNELNNFNLADDLMEAYRPIVDHCVATLSQQYPANQPLDKSCKATLVGLLHQDITRLANGTVAGVSSMLALMDATVISLTQSINIGSVQWVLPALTPPPIKANSQ